MILCRRINAGAVAAEDREGMGARGRGSFLARQDLENNAMGQLRLLSREIDKESGASKVAYVADAR